MMIRCCLKLPLFPFCFSWSLTQNGQPETVVHLFPIRDSGQRSRSVLADLGQGVHCWVRRYVGPAVGDFTAGDGVKLSQEKFTGMRTRGRALLEHGELCRPTGMLLSIHTMLAGHTYSGNLQRILSDCKHMSTKPMLPLQALTARAPHGMPRGLEAPRQRKSVVLAGLRMCQGHDTLRMEKWGAEPAMY